MLAIIGCLLLLGAALSLTTRYAIRRGRTRLGLWCLCLNIVTLVLIGTTIVHRIIS